MHLGHISLKISCNGQNAMHIYYHSFSWSMCVNYYMLYSSGRTERYVGCSNNEYTGP